MLLRGKPAVALLRPHVRIGRTHRSVVVGWRIARAPASSQAAVLTDFPRRGSVRLQVPTRERRNHHGVLLIVPMLLRGNANPGAPAPSRADWPHTPIRRGRLA